MTKNSLIPVQTSVQNCFIVSRSVPKISQSIFRIFLSVSTKKFNTLIKIPLMPFQTLSQSPVKMPMNTSSIFRIMSVTALKISAISWKTPSNTGAKKLQSPSHTVFMTSAMSLKLNPSPFSLSTMPCVKFWKIFFICSQIAVILFRNSSFVFQRWTNAATSTAITATMATTGALMPPIAALTAENADFTFVRIDGIFETTCIILPTVDMVFPTPISNGPIAATMSAIFRMVSFVAGDNWFSLSTSAWILETIARMVGISISPKEIASSCNCDFRIVICPLRLSCIVSAMFCAVPSQL